MSKYKLTDSYVNLNWHQNNKTKTLSVKISLCVRICCLCWHSVKDEKTITAKNYFKILPMFNSLFVSTYMYKKG